LAAACQAIELRIRVVSNRREKARTLIEIARMGETWRQPTVSGELDAVVGMAPQRVRYRNEKCQSGELTGIFVPQAGVRPA